ncbi:hypothetical protein [Helicobacter ailurogastricus]|uniref:tetratricopeptide repeat protein n=1 Tax=Helicobacter ailurogastricus TaxID=1578720 RepID=UPI00255482CA|nr:hypothetical protein [Helicobacter ailurogastricus]
MGEIDALPLLGTLYSDGDGATKDLHKALECFQKATDMGDPFVDGALEDVYVKLGCMYYKGQDVPQDYKKALQYIRKVADMGNTDVTVF